MTTATTTIAKGMKFRSNGVISEVKRVVTSHGITHVESYPMFGTRVPGSWGFDRREKLAAAIEDGTVKLV